MALHESKNEDRGWCNQLMRSIDSRSSSDLLHFDMHRICTLFDHCRAGPILFQMLHRWTVREPSCHAATSFPLQGQQVSRHLQRHHTTTSHSICVYSSAAIVHKDQRNNHLRYLGASSRRDGKHPDSPALPLQASVTLPKLAELAELDFLVELSISEQHDDLSARRAPSLAPHQLQQKLLITTQSPSGTLQPRD